MNKIETTTDLKKAILQLEYLQTADLILLKNQFTLAYEALRPINIIKRNFSEMVLAPGSRSNAVNAVIGLVSGFAAKKFFVGRSSNPITKLAGIVLETVIANKITKNADQIKAIGNIMLKRLLSHSNDPEKS
jgi:hypothetical protein